MAPELVLVLGDQLDRRSPALDAAACDEAVVLMIESAGEAAHAWSHKQRIALFL
ncbi:MAG TPA: cryptochrome/photolyase family protein, partial [Gammaproteobacteria bacterium]|nr:cryptochrome/photolyase family protein [Gammaproteobacteria bacterium]